MKSGSWSSFVAAGALGADYGVPDDDPPPASGYQFLRLAGRCRNGAERDAGRRFHAVAPGRFAAICGARPGKRSAGWSSHAGEEATCPACLRQLQRDPPPVSGAAPEMPPVGGALMRTDWGERAYRAMRDPEGLGHIIAALEGGRPTGEVLGRGDTPERAWDDALRRGFLATREGT